MFVVTLHLKFYGLIWLHLKGANGGFGIETDRIFSFYPFCFVKLQIISVGVSGI